MKECIKKQFEKHEIEVELENLQRNESELIWYSEQCRSCGLWHVVREYPVGYVREEAKKAIAIWKERRERGIEGF